MIQVRRQITVSKNEISKCQFLIESILGPSTSYRSLIFKYEVNPVVSIVSS